MKKEHIGPLERPVVEASFKKYELSRKVRSGLLWGTINLFVVAFTVSEILYGSVFEDLSKHYPVIWYIELLVAFWSVLRLLFDSFFCLQWLIDNPVILTPKQYQLLAVDPRDKRFCTTFQENHPQQNRDQTPYRGLYENSGVSPVVPISSPSRIVSPNISGHLGSYSPTMSSCSFGSSYYTAPSARMSSGHYSPSYQEMTSQVYHSPSSVNMSLRNRLKGSTEGSPYSPTKFSPVHYNDVTMASDVSDVSLKYPSPGTSPFSDDRIRDVNTLHSYLQTQEEKSELFHRDGCSPSRMNSSGLMNTSGTHDPYTLQWSPYGSRTECTTPLNVYKIGTRDIGVSKEISEHQAETFLERSALTTSKDEDEFGHMSPQAEELWQKFGAYRQDLDLWTENLRKWISQTVLCKLVSEIDEVNANLQRIGSSELQIGMISLGSLRQVSTTKAEHVPTLANILPYLELSNNQEYLVRRIQELGNDSCMGVYRWKLGSDYRGRRWDQDLPTDAQIVMHVFCTYMDSRLPTDARFPDGRTFTGLYFLKNLDKLESKKRDLAIYRFRQNPPHFKVIVGDEVFDVGKGRNNLFHSIILFLLMVKTKHHGMLGRVNLGPSGVNILGIFSKR